MTTGATGQLGLALPVQGELSGTWGNTVNNGITQYTNIAIAGTLTLTNDGAVTLANTTGDASASNITSSLTGAGTVTAQFAIIQVTGTLTATKVITAPSYSKTYVVDNTTATYGVTFKASGQTGVTIVAGEKCTVYFNGTDYVKVATSVVDGVSTISFGTTGLTPSTATAGAVTVAGTLVVGNGGTGLTSLTANYIPYGNGTSAFGSSSGLQYISGILTTSNDASVNGLTVGRGGGADINSTAIGSNALGSQTTGGYNTAVGRNALTTNSTGFSNVAFGYFALQANTSNDNSAFGTNALTTNTSGSSNTAIGRSALQANTTASNNTAVGYRAGYLNSTGQFNCFVGDSSGQSITTGSANTILGSTSGTTVTTGSGVTAIGYSTIAANASTASNNTAVGCYALRANSTGTMNTALGGGEYGVDYGALGYNTTGSNNTAVGHYALRANTTASYNTAVGYQAAYTNTTGDRNVAIGGPSQGTGGTSALYSNTTGVQNTAVGAGALKSNTTANNNVAVGLSALYANTTGTQNTAVGTNAGASLTVAGGDNNTAVGYNALTTAAGAACEVNTAIGSSSLSNLTTGTGNTALGYASGVGLTTGLRCTFVGRSAVGNNANAQEEIVISAGPCTGQGDNYVTIGKNGAKIYNKYDTNATWTYTSDGRLKQNITADSLGLSFINRLRTVTYQWKPSNEVPSDMPQYGEVNTRNTTEVMHGLIAQEVKAALDAEGVTTFAGWDQGPDGVQAVSREMFITPIIKAVQELTAQVETLKAEVAALKGN